MSDKPPVDLFDAPLSDIAGLIDGAALAISSRKTTREARITFPDGTSMRANPVALLRGVAVALRARELPEGRELLEAMRDRVR